MNSVNLVARLVRDPELRYIPGSGTAVCNFTLAVDKNLSKEKKQEMESRNQATADFINCVAWGKLGENVANYMSKGKLVGVTGSLVSGSYEAKDGTKRYTTDVNCQSVEFLEFGDKKGNSNDDLADFHPIDNDSIPF